MKKYNFIKDILLYPQQLNRIARQINFEIQKFYRRPGDDMQVVELVVITVAMGGRYFSDLVFSFPVAKNLGIIHHELLARSYGHDTKSSGKVTIEDGYKKKNLAKLRKKVDGRPVLIIDDIFETGRTLKHVSKYIENECSPSSVEHCVMISRDLHFYDMKPKFVGHYTRNDKFLVGAGLDYQDNFRFLPYVGIVDPDFKKEDGFYEEHICNKCGGSCEAPEAVSYPPSSYGLINGEVAGYYESPVLEDCTGYRFDICEKCLKKLFDTFVVPVEERERSPWEG